MRKIQHTIDIPAAPTLVWQILTATDQYADWNPFITQLDGELREGERLRLRVTPGKRSMTFTPTVLAVQEHRLLRWRGRLGVRGIFDGVHEFRLEPLPDGGTRFIQRELFSGVLVPLLARVLDDTVAGFVVMNEALKDRAMAVRRDMETTVTKQSDVGATSHHKGMQ